MILSLRPGALGGQVGDTSYPSVGCNGVLTLKDANAQTVTVSEHITTPNCIGSTLVLRVSGQSLTVEATDPPEKG
jgi:hypothetical protein